MGYTRTSDSRLQNIYAYLKLNFSGGWEFESEEGEISTKQTVSNADEFFYNTLKQA